jgi:hypothetical protein
VPGLLRIAIALIDLIAVTTKEFADFCLTIRTIFESQRILYLCGDGMRAGTVSPAATGVASG